MGSHGGLDSASLRDIDRVCDAFEAAWQRGERPAIEQFACGRPEPAYSALVYELVLIDVAYCRRAGETPQLASYQALFPNCGELPRIFPAGEPPPPDRAADGPSDSPQSGSGRPPTAAPLPPELKQKFADYGYQLLGEIGRGTFGCVLRAIRAADGRTVAIKLLDQQQGPAGATAVLRFLREMDVHSRLRHPAIVPYLADGEIDNQYLWFVMDYIDGPDLQRLVAQHPGGLPPRSAVEIVRQVLDGLSEFHKSSLPDGPFVHRDIKPRNILVQGYPTAPRAYLTDFGLAKNFEQAGRSGLTRTGMVCGTVLYMPAEQLFDSKYVGPEVDVFAMGAVLYFALCGEPLYDLPADATHSQIVAQVSGRRIVPLVQRRSDLPPALHEVVRRALGVDRVKRFRTANQMLLALAELPEGW